MKDITELMEYARGKHRGQKRKNGDDYIAHPLIVALMLSDAGFDKDTVAAGLFHDLLEDTDATEEEILALTNERVLDAVKLVTKRSGLPEEDYIVGILKNPVAKAVKNADRIHNLSESLNGDSKFAAGYAEDTRKYYLHRFSDELDKAYEKLCEKFNLN